MRHESWQKVQKGISDKDKLKYYKCVETLALQERARSLVRSLLEHLFHFLFMFYYINNDRPEVHWMSEIQFNFLNHILLILVLSLLLLLLLLLLKMANEQFKGFK